MEQARRPQISVVIASINGWDSIEQCLTALAGQKGDIQAEVIVADACIDGTSERINQKFPWVRLLAFDKRLSIPELRAIGMSEASGEIIAVTEDHCIPCEDWYQKIVHAHQSSYAVVGGAVENGSVDRLVDWAVYLCEYSHAMLPIASGEVHGVAGNNASYKREVLEKVDDSVKRTCWEFFLHEELRKAGARFLSVPGIVVSHKKRFGFLYFLLQRFHYSRSFAGMRTSRSTISKRLLYVLFSPLLPFLMVVRMAREVLRKRRHVREFLLALPLLSVFLVSYACGELVGYLLGSGKSLVKVE